MHGFQSVSLTVKLAVVIGLTMFIVGYWIILRQKNPMLDGAARETGAQRAGKS